MAYELASTRLLKDTMRAYFGRLGAAAADPAKKVAWCTSVGPAELLRSFGFEVYFPENHGALLGATRAAGDHIPVAVKQGYSGDICSYLTSDIGAYLERTTPLAAHYGLKEIPRPDLLVYCTNQCREVQEWFSFFAREFKAPIAGVHPPRHLDTVTETEIADISAQFKNLIPICEQVTGVKFDIDRFREAVRISKDAAVLWRAVLETATASPAPLSFFDGCIHMGPIVVMRGTQEAVDYYKALYDELAANVKKGIGVVPKERVRLYWDGMPIWGKLRPLSNLLHQEGAVVVASTYCNSWIFDQMDERDPFASTARAYGEIFINRSESAKMKILQDLMTQFRIDGVVFHDARTCFNNSNASFGMPQRLRAATGVRTIIIEGDLNDLRFYSEGQTTTKLEAFLEQLTDIPAEA